jgi:cell division protein FtsX
MGAVGVGTLMTIAVTERTGEIGLLRALGARRADILGGFLIEAALLGCVGGAAGLGMSPCNRMRWRVARAPGSGTGTADIRDCV